MGSKRGQSAMEFLMTYGWAILIMLVVIAILFMLGVFNPKAGIPESCVLPAGFSCYSYRIDSTGKLYLDLGQAKGRTLYITGLSCSAESNGSATNFASPVLLENGMHRVVADGIQCVDENGDAVTAGDSYRGKLLIAYRESGSTITRYARGDISAKLEGGTGGGGGGGGTPTPTPTPTQGGTTYSYSGTIYYYDPPWNNQYTLDGATITMTKSTGEEYTDVSESGGLYEVSGLPEGFYMLRVDPPSSCGTNGCGPSITDTYEMINYIISDRTNRNYYLHEYYTGKTSDGDSCTNWDNSQCNSDSCRGYNNDQNTQLCVPYQNSCDACSSCSADGDCYYEDADVGLACDTSLHLCVEREPGSYVSSCPFLYTWNGTGYVIVTDISATAGILGVSLGDGTYKKSIPGDYAKIASAELQENDGAYNMQITEELDEISYLDQVSLLTVDHAPTVDVYTGLLRANLSAIYTVGKDPLSPVSCTDADGNDCLPKVVGKDGVYALAPRDSMNTLDLNLGDLSGASSVKLIVTGFSTFGNGSSNDRFVQVKDAGGDWVTIYNNTSIKRPAGLPRTYVIDLTGKFLTNNYEVRLAYMRSSFDYIAIDTTPQEPVVVNTYPLTSADLHYRGYSGTSGGPVMSYDYNSVTGAILGYSDPTGNFTKYGDVAALLGSTDDEYVVMHHGDEITVSFPYATPAGGQARDFLLYSYDYYKPADYVNGNTVGPLPFQAMSNYPYAESEHYPDDAEHQAYLATWNTREYNGSG